jgi:hypothetical protein
LLPQKTHDSQKDRIPKPDAEAKKLEARRRRADEPTCATTHRQKGEKEIKSTGRINSVILPIEHETRTYNFLTYG